MKTRRRYLKVAQEVLAHGSAEAYRSDHMTLAMFDAFWTSGSSDGLFYPPAGALLLSRVDTEHLCFALCLAAAMHE